MDKISVIIPVLNEALYIGNLLDHLITNSSKENIEEIIVVDGGSSDDSKKIISSFEKVILLNAPRGRAKQLNFGAQEAKGAILYFLHADSFPPKGFDRAIVKETDRNNTGCFRLEFENPNHILFKIASWFTRFNYSLFRGGDQSLFIRKKDFDFLNGYNERYIIYEDIELISRIYNRFAFKVIPDYILTSERKFRKNGVWKLYYYFLMIHVKSWLGASPETLYQYYHKHIQE